MGAAPHSKVADDGDGGRQGGVVGVLPLAALGSIVRGGGQEFGGDSMVHGCFVGVAALNVHEVLYNEQVGRVVHWGVWRG